VKVKSSSKIHSGSNADDHDDTVPEGSRVGVGDNLEDRVIEDFLLEIESLGVIGEVDARVIEGDEGRGIAIATAGH
jgi:hypothetical protein